MSQDLANNRVEILGTLEDEPEFVDTGKQDVVYLYVSLDRRHRDQHDVIPVRAYGPKGLELAKKAHQGDLVLIAGALRTGRSRPQEPYSMTQVYVRVSSWIVFAPDGGIAAQS